MNMTTQQTRETMSEAVKVIGATALLIAYAVLSHWSHSDRLVAAETASTQVSLTQNIDA